MEKTDLESIIDRLCESLLCDVKASKNLTIEHIVEFLNNSIQTFKEIDTTKADSIQKAKDTFTNHYKEIANKSLNSYQHTNSKFEELAQMHQKTVEKCNENTIDFPAIRDQFSAIQDHMEQEIQKANDVISTLTKQVKILEESSAIDSLTKVFNRRMLNEYLDEICHKINSKEDLHLLLLDIDDFKQVNDTYGHIAGDKILIFISNMLRKTLRDGDKIFRYGGEEFVIVLNRISTPGCKKIAQRILHIIADNKLIYKGDSLSVTVSIGSTQFHIGDTPSSLLDRADSALYKSKRNGKNQLTSELYNGD